MFLFLLTRQSWDYDEHGSVLIRAATEQDARRIASEAKLCVPQGAWISETTKCEVISVEGDPEVILDIFHAG